MIKYIGLYRYHMMWTRHGTLLHDGPAASATKSAKSILSILCIIYIIIYSWAMGIYKSKRHQDPHTTCGTPSNKRISAAVRLRESALRTRTAMFCYLRLDHWNQQTSTWLYPSWRCAIDCRAWWIGSTFCASNLTWISKCTHRYSASSLFQQTTLIHVRDCPS